MCLSKQAFRPEVHHSNHDPPKQIVPFLCVITAQRSQSKFIFTHTKGQAEKPELQVLRVSGWRDPFTTQPTVTRTVTERLPIVMSFTEKLREVHHICTFKRTIVPFIQVPPCSSLLMT